MKEAWLCYSWSYHEDEDEDDDPEPSIKFSDPGNYGYNKIVHIVYAVIEEKD